MTLWRVRAGMAAAFLPASCAAAMAHASERGHVMLLPTGHYLIGGGAAVALTFLMLVGMKPSRLDRLIGCSRRLFIVPFDGRAAFSVLSFLFLLALVLAGFTGSRDPLSNPLPLAVWTLMWVGLTLLHGLLGHLWAWLNPWYGPWRLLVAAGLPANGLLPLPGPRSMAPAALLLFAFAWYELVHPSPEDPSRLALVVAVYWCLTFAGMMLFGFRRWSRRVEFLSVFFAMVARLSILSVRVRRGRRVLHAGLPGHKLHRRRPLPPSGVAFLLVALGSVSFDGFMRSFVWLAAIGVNPLDFPGRSAVMVPNTLGLAGMAALLCAAFLAAARIGSRLAGGARPARPAGLLVWSVVPIALAYHFAHYLVALAVNGQYALRALTDPFGRGWNLFGRADAHVHAGIALGADAARIVWNLQAAAIIAGHVLAVAIAHHAALLLFGSPRAAGRSQIPMALLMIGYTLFGLWLLSTPTAG